MALSTQIGSYYAFEVINYFDKVHKKCVLLQITIPLPSAFAFQSYSRTDWVSRKQTVGTNC